jgi:hypothetical protein
MAAFAAVVPRRYGWMTYKVARGLGMLQIENQARI